MKLLRANSILLIGLLTAAVITAAVIVRYKRPSSTASDMSESREPAKNRAIVKGSFASISPEYLGTAVDESLRGKPLPTNTWWISALSGQFPEALFTLPAVVKIQEEGVLYGLPEFTVTPDYFLSQQQQDISLSFTEGVITSSKVIAFDQAGPTLALYRGAEKVAEMRLVKGSPIQHISLEESVVITTAGELSEASRLTDGRWVVSTAISGRSYRIYSSVKPEFSNTQKQYTLAASSRVTLAALPDNVSSLQEFDAASAMEVVSAAVSLDKTATTTSTSIAYTTTGGNGLFVLLPNQQNSGTAPLKRMGEYATIRGKAYLVATTVITSVAENTEEPALFTLPREDSFFSNSRLEGYLQEETLEKKDPVGSYGAGKELFRLANLALLANQSKSDTAAVFTARLKLSLTDWLTYSPGEKDHYFAIDETHGGLIAQAPEYGIERYNDHHFQYGYYLYAAAVLASIDSTFVSEWGGAVDMIAQDIANIGASDRPFLRVSDMYEGHSWAAGTDRFADGNNQESISEAIHAWYSLALWGKLSGDSEAEKVGMVLLNQEVAASRMYVFNQGPASAKFPNGYEHSSISMLWAGKSDWATWFSAMPEAKHAIIYLPLTPASRYLAKGSLLEDEKKSLTKELAGKDPGLFQDILLMTDAMRDPIAAQEQFSDSLPLDSSNSRAYVYAWLAMMAQNTPK